MKFQQISIALLLVMILFTGGSNLSAQNEDLPTVIDYNQHIKPLLSDRCFICHGPDANKRQAGLRLDQSESAYAKLPSGNLAIVPGDTNQSSIVKRIHADNSGALMPPPESNLSLNENEKALIKKWIEQGAEYKPHWSLIPLQQTKAAEVLKVEDVNTDTFIEQKLHHEGLSLSPQTDKETLLRRVSFDLTGLPPTMEEIDAFIQDDSSNAYEKVVDRLLASPQYGERMALEWLDVARYADTYGYQADNYRPTWRYRDWVIEAYNQNMPFDQFITDQLAGDLLPNPTTDQLIATGFNRNHPQNAEGGIVNEEFRVEYVADRAITTGRAFMGLTMECARCHDHKYDPITQKEFYQLFAFFNNVDEAGQITWNNSDKPSPTTLLFKDEEKQKIAELDEQIKTLNSEINHYIFQTWKSDALKKWFSKERFMSHTLPIAGKVAHFSLDQKNVTNEEVSGSVNEVTGRIIDTVSMKIWDQPPQFVLRDVDGYDLKSSNAMELDGDAMLDFPGIGRFKKADPFTVSMYVWIPNELEEGVIFHSNKGGIIYSFKGYQVSVENNKFDVRLSHTFPYNSINLVSNEPVPREEWVHIALTYDGSGKAVGTHFYVNGEPAEMLVKRDNLYKDIVFDGITTNLRVGARWRSRGFTNGKIDELTVYDRELTRYEINPHNSHQDSRGLILRNAQHFMDYQKYDLTADEKIAGSIFYLTQNKDQHYNELLEKLRTLRQAKNEIYEKAEEVFVMADMPEPRQAYLLERGAYDAHGEPVEPGTVKQVLPFDDSLPKNRLGLSQWLVDEQNPLTARVAVNRLWQICFGVGLVETAEDFGSQGELPTHPDLLDWLALQYMHSGWDTKALMKQIVMSKTYRQSSLITEHQREVDPENRLYAHYPTKRLPAEMLRDQALAASGLLVDTIGGPSVKPYQPEGLWSYGSNSKYEQSTGDDLYRRGMYTFWKRTVPPPAMNTFDAPDRSYCIMRRQETNTPLQALVMMNDPQFLEAAKMLAVKVINSSNDTEEWIKNTFRLLTARMPQEIELVALQSYYHNQIKQFESNPDSYQSILDIGEAEIPNDINQGEVAAMTLVASTVMNSNASVFLR